MLVLIAIGANKDKVVSSDNSLKPNLFTSKNFKKI